MHLNNEIRHIILVYVSLITDYAVPYNGCGSTVNTFDFRSADGLVLASVDGDAVVKWMMQMLIVLRVNSGNQTDLGKMLQDYNAQTADRVLLNTSRA